MPGPDDPRPDRSSDADADDSAERAEASRPALREDPKTGSTQTDPAAEETGPYGEDPMAGPAPSG